MIRKLGVIFALVSFLGCTRVQSSWSSELIQFAETLEDVCIKTVESGDMTKDLALLIDKKAPWLTTNQFLDKLQQNLQARLEK